MRTPAPAPSALTAALGLLLLMGCDAGPLLTPVRGKVCFKGVPLKQGTIVFSPDTKLGNHGPTACAEIQADGGYTLHSGEQAGALVGWHRITVVAVEAPGPETAPEKRGGRRFRIPRSLLPEKYSDPEFSGLSREVEGGKENIFDFNLD